MRDSGGEMRSQGVVSKKQHNVIATLYNRKHAPYVYGAFHIVRGELSKQWTTKPFVVSKKTATGEVIVYGSVLRMLLKILFQIEKLREFSIRADAILGQAALPVKKDPLLIGVPIADGIMDDHEELIGEVLLVTSVRVRILSEMFPERLKQHTVPVYDYNDKQVDSVQVRHIGNLIAHNRYVCVVDDQVVDLYSDQRTLSGVSEIGLKIRFLECIAEVEAAVRGLTVRDLLRHLHSELAQLSTASGNKEIVDLHQNLYTLGGLVSRQPGSIVPAPLKAILDRAAAKCLERKHPSGPPKGEDHQSVMMKCTTPRFFWEQDLDDKRIRVSLFVNDEPETLVMDLGEFFQEMEAAYGDSTLLEAAGFPNRTEQE